MFGKILEYNLSRSSIIFLDLIPRSGMYRVKGLNLLNSWCIVHSRKVIPIYTSINSTNTLPPPVSFWPESKHRWWALAPKEKKKKPFLFINKGLIINTQTWKVKSRGGCLGPTARPACSSHEKPAAGPPHWSTLPLSLGLWVCCSLCWSTSTRPTHCQPSCLFLQEFFSNPQSGLNTLPLCFGKPLD